MLLITQLTVDTLVQASVQTYPHECCGFLFGCEQGHQQVVSSVLACRNAATVTRNSFAIAASDYMAAEQTAEQLALLLLGIYHSHPDCDAIPSPSDLAAAFPGFSYLIVSVYQAQVSSLRSWKLNEHSLFTEEKIIIN